MAQHEIPGGGDALARGAKRQTFPMGGDSKDAPVKLRNVASDQSRAEMDAIPATVDNSALFAKPHVCYRGQPLSDRVLVKRVPHDSNSPIIIPDSAKGKSDMGILVSLAHGSKLTIGPGCLILFDKFAAVGQELELADENGVISEYLLVQECDVLLELTPYTPDAGASEPCVQ